MLDIDTAIKHCLEVTEENDLAAGTYEILAENNHNAYERLTAKTNSSRCAECAADHRQLAEWLMELKEAKWLLKLALQDLAEAEHCGLCKYDDDIPTCQSKPVNCFVWRYADEALKLIGGSENE